MPEVRGIDYFGRNLPFTKLHIKAALQARRKMYVWLRKQVGTVEDQVFLDHGSTPDTVREDSNCFIRWLTEDGAIVYATSPEDISHLEKVFPGLAVISWPPEKNNLDKVDYIISSAVIEHVGTEQQQIQYINNLLQISNNILITTPNRYHWLEFHTKIPLLHWLPRYWHRRILKLIGMNFWSNENNLHLLSKKDLLKIINISAEFTKFDINATWYEPKFLGMVSNLVVLLSNQNR
ncbi:MAG: hypothetical protein KME59_03415 [Trichormus sp. ATA11-4-KO1]|jgi:hypothetical protein|nr:hypothetical protein [Trichormus sp. ATA11-4-KO1]